MGYTTYESYVLLLNWDTVNPDDSKNYLVGFPSGLTEIGAWNRIYVPRAGTVRTVYVAWNNVTQDCTAEDTSFYLRKNNTTDSDLIYTGTFANAASPQSSSNLNFAVAKGDFLHLKVVTPAWVTNPTGVRLTCVIEVQC